MNESARTLTFVVVAAVAAIVALVASPSTQLTPPGVPIELVGREFYPDFKNPNEPTSLQVINFNEAQAIAKLFAVEFKNGLWTIPSHHHYPADGEDRLSKTAASIVGVKRDEFRSSATKDHEELGVIDPLSKDDTKLKGRGQRITLKKGETAVADLIIGKQVKDRQGYYFVRRPDENTTWVSKLDINLSTKFGDWVETDLLKLNRDDLVSMAIDDHKVDEVKRRIVPGTITELDRAKSADPWKLKDIDEEKEELDPTKINDLVATLDDVRLVGVRPKPKGMRPDLSLDQKFVDNQLALDALQSDLASKGYFLASDRSGKLQLFSNEGQLTAATNKGVVYTLRFGEVFTGDEMEVEAGVEGDKKKAEAKEGAKDADKKDTAAENKASRYLMVSAAFDESHLGPKPVKPEPPAGATEEKPAGEKKADDKAPATEKKAEEKSATKKEEGAGCGQDEKKQEPDAAKKDSAEDKPVAEKKEGQPEAEKPAEPMKTAAELQKEYQDAVKKYEADLKAYEDKVKSGKEQVDKLNVRFGDWYYVISAENFNKLHVTRKDLVKAKEKAEDKKTDEKKTEEEKPNEPKSEPKTESTEKPAAKKKEEE